MVTKLVEESLYENLSLELRRGALVLAVLTQLKQEQYGYSLKQSLGELGMDIGEGTLYPLLRRLEKQGLLKSEWRVVDGTRPRRYYQISKVGETILMNLMVEWRTLVGVMDGLMIIAEGEKTGAK